MRTPEAGAPRHDARSRNSRRAEFVRFWPGRSALRITGLALVVMAMLYAATVAAAPMDYGMTARPRIRILLVEDHALVREGTAAIVDAQEDLEVVGMAADAGGAVQRAHELAPDVVLLDFRIPGGGPEVARRIAHVAPATRVFVVSAYGQPDYVESMRQVGVAGYMLKSATPNALVKAIRRVHAGATVFDDVPGAAQPSESGLPSAAGDIEPLTMRELDVLRLVALGASNREIAETLGVSTKTVEAHLSSVYAKLGVRSRTEAVVKSARAGIISVDFLAEPV